MKTTPSSTNRRHAGFTIVEMLVVISIIAILAGLLLPVLAGVKTKAKKAKAKVEMNLLVNGIKQYESEYSRPPMSKTVEAGLQDYAFGYGNNEPNSQVISILLSNPTNTLANANFSRNPRRLVLLNAQMTYDTNSAGLGPDLVYRDPWGTPYVIALDVDYDEKCNDPITSAIYGPINASVAVWSFGPDRQADPSKPRKASPNQDNITSWQP